MKIRKVVIHNPRVDIVINFKEQPAPYDPLMQAISGLMVMAKPKSPTPNQEAVNSLEKVKDEVNSN